MSEDFGFNLDTVFGNGGNHHKTNNSKKNNRKKSKDEYGIYKQDNDFMSYIDSGDQDGGMGGFGEYLNYGNERVGKRKSGGGMGGFGDYLYYGNDKRKGGRSDDFMSYIPDIGAGYKDKNGVSGFTNSIAKSAGSISKATRSTVKSYNEHKAKAEKEKDERREKQMQEKERKESQRREKELREEKQKEETNEKDYRYSGKSQVAEEDKESMR
jgi:hypothetical protein